MKNQKDYSKLDGVLKVLLILFISLLSFSTGVYAGKKFSEKQYDLVSLNEKEYAKEKFPTHASEEEGETELPLSQKEIESLSEESVRIAQAEEQNSPTEKVAVADTNNSARAIASADSKTAAHAGDSVTPTSTSASQRVANDKTPSQNVAPKTQSHSMKLPQGVGTQLIEYTVQVGSYPTEVEAKKHANDLTAKGFPSFTVPADIKGHTWYRVSVGSFKTAEDANLYKSELMQKAAVKSAYVQKITK